MKSPLPSRLQQIRASRNGDGYEPVASYEPDKTRDVQDWQALQTALLRLCPAKTWYKNSQSTCCPRPVLITQEHQQQLSELHTALVLAITDIVERWWSDSEAKFPERMPLERKEEDLLRWMDGQTPQLLPPYRDCRGSWRPDFLVEEVSLGENLPPAEIFRISEINARFSFNGYMLLAHGQQALQDIGISNTNNGLKGATDPQMILEGLLDLIQPGVPLHLLKGEEAGVDVHMFADWLRRNTGITLRFITPSDLRLFPDPQSKGGYKLCCVVNNDLNSTAPPHPALDNSTEELLEEVYQIGMELHQRELLALQPEMLRQISLRCFNDMRTILLVHDKRMLGIVKQELRSLVEREVLTQAQAHALDLGIADTILPGSLELYQLLERCRSSPDLRTEYLLKPVRSGKGDGIVFGDELSPTEWLSKLELLKCPQLNQGGTTLIVQRKVEPILYDMMLKSPGTMAKLPLIGTYHSVHGQYLGLGVWRSSADRVCAISHGGAWMCSVMDDN
ncbi:hypothetical protein BDV26DRAFT_302844 [Aspergillus bertholletiae]|uniref:Uncharacterized protein n=1 Tax=Aspergillus bertholletiae TaxID=1226010 RepID=A0A5N7BF47_9EURO|nr:hypothetical protein BDV26DRAFT_302844 [Aspergillus bertholletiae]